MLRFLRITRLAVIDAAEVEFAPGLNVLTGETGAGKSILVGAVGLLLGGRASADLVRSGEDLATVEAIFDTPDGAELIVRREVTAQGRSRAFVNGALVTAAALKDATAGLVELHGQHEHQTLLDPMTHLEVLDDFAELAALRAPVREAFEALQQSSEALRSARNLAADRERRLEVVQFQLAEIEKANPAPGEDEALLATRQVLANADRVERLCSSSYSALYDRDGSIVDELAAVWRQVGELAAIEPQFAQYYETREAISSQLEDLAMFLRRYADRIDGSPAKLHQTEDRLALLERLKRKYGPSLSDVIAKRAALAQERADLDSVEQRIEDLERANAEATERFLRAARALSGARREAAVGFARVLERELRDVAMEQTRFEVRFSDELPDDRWSASGLDEAQFFVSPNPGEDLRPLARIVSGGELSRIMLAIKTLGALHRRSPDAEGGGGMAGLVFDEVDAGIGGRVADMVGRKLAALARGFQVLCITHLPQIAAYAGTHFQIAKVVEGGRTHTRVVRLDTDGRVDEIGRMLGGAVVSDGIRASARELLARSQEAAADDPDPRGGRPTGKSEKAKAKVDRRGEGERQGRR